MPENQNIKFSLPDGIDWYEDFLDFCKKESIMPSHLATHIYSCMDILNAFQGIFPYPKPPITTCP